MTAIIAASVGGLEFLALKDHTLSKVRRCSWCLCNEGMKRQSRRVANIGRDFLEIVSLTVLKECEGGSVIIIRGIILT